MKAGEKQDASANAICRLIRMLDRSDAAPHTAATAERKPTTENGSPINATVEMQHMMKRHISSK